VITFAAEKRRMLMLVVSVLSGILGVMILAGGICAGAAGNTIAGRSFGPLGFAAGVIIVKNTAAATRGGYRYAESLRIATGASAAGSGVSTPGAAVPASLLTWLWWWLDGSERWSRRGER
jgi:hypothetical protein